MSGIHIDSNNATKTAAPRPGAIIEVKPAPPIKKIEDEHRQRRLFLGPMPNNVASGEVFNEPAAQNLGIGKKIGLGIRKRFSLASQHRRSLSSEDSVSRERAYLYFISNGGRPEEFESKEKSVKAEILRRVRDTRWFESASAGAQDPNAAAKKWVGDTFEIGKDVLGLSMLVPEEEEPPVIGRTSVSEGIRGTATSPEENAVSFSKILGATVESRGSKTSASKPGSSKAPASTKSGEGDEHRETPISHGTPDSPDFVSNEAVAESSKTRLLSPSPLPASSSSVSLSRPGALDPSRRQDKVSESTSRREITSITPSSKKGSESPKIEALSPTEVLTREPSPTTSAGAVARMQEELLPDDESGILMRVLSTPSAIQKYLDEQQLLEMPETRRDRNTMWREYLVVWKNRCIELYEPYA
ncbi:5248_t:CDS:2, partial [Acaulospora colombiana]